MVVAQIGERTYEFHTHLDLIEARGIYAKCIGGQNDFESELEKNDIEFNYEMPG